MRVSVVMAVHDAAPYVGEALDSVLGQSSPPDEVIVVDDGSSDDTPRVLDRYTGRIVRLSQDNQGQTAALNRAVAAAQGDLLAFQDADDIWCNRKLEMQVGVLESDPRVDAVFGLVRQFVSPDVPETMRRIIAPINEILPGEVLTCLLIRRPVFNQIGPFDPSFPMVGAIEWLGRAKRLGLQSRMLQEVVALRRLHRNNHGRLNTASRDAETLLALKRIIAERKRVE
jgi:glycosyltransferase involved in cell wall biosynthesis